MYGGKKRKKKKKKHTKKDGKKQKNVFELKKYLRLQQKELS